MIVTKKELESITKVACSQPHAILGMHLQVRKKKSLVVRAYLDDAVSCEVVDITSPDGPRYPLKRLSPDGFFEGIIDRAEPFLYRLRIERYNEEIRRFFDPYRFLPTLSEEDVYYFNGGNDHQAHNKLGGHVRVVDGVQGVQRSLGTECGACFCCRHFNHWDGRYHPMRSLGASGIWELFIPGVEEGAKYKYEIGTRNGFPQLKTDPYGTRFEAPPYNASIVCKLDKHVWGDQEWLERRASTD